MPASLPLISVIVPSYNYGYLLPRALDSVLNQLADDIELIVVDDGSVDDTPQVLADYVVRFPALHVTRQENAGAAAARNRGINMARGRYALLLDADDELMENALSVLRECVTAQPDVGMVLGGHVSVYPDGLERLHIPSRVAPADARTLAKRYLLQKRIAVSHGCSLFRRDILERRPYPEHLRGSEDIPVFLHMLINGPVLTINTPLARIHKHPGSLRHQREGAEQRARWLIEEVFATLPNDCMSLRGRYKSQRYLSLFRAAWKAGDQTEAGLFYRQALNAHFWHALKWIYLRKIFRLWWSK